MPKRYPPGHQDIADTLIELLHIHCGALIPPSDSVVESHEEGDER